MSNDQLKKEYERAKNIDFSKYAELRDLWDKHPSNTQGAYARGNYRPAEGEAAQVLRRYGELSQQLSDDLGGRNTLEAMMALGGIGSDGIDPTSAKESMKRAAARSSYLTDPNRPHQNFETGAYRGAAIISGDRKPNLNFVLADRLANLAGQLGTPEEINFYRKLADQEELKGTKFYETGGRGGLPTQEEKQKFNWISQYGTPEQIDYTNQLATQLRSAQPQGMMSLPSLTGLLNTSSAQMPLSSKFFNTSSNNPLQTYLQTLETPYYIDLVKRLFRKQ